MLSPKYFSKFLIDYEAFDVEDFCDYCDDCDCPRTKTVAIYCPKVIEAKKEHNYIERREFEIVLGSRKRKKNEEWKYYIFDSYKIISIEIGKVKPYFYEKWIEKYEKIRYKKIDCSKFKSIFRYHPKGQREGSDTISYYDKEFQVKHLNCYYDRKYVYFALKIVKDPIFWYPKKIIAPLVVQNDKITISIAPRYFKDDD